MATEAIAERSEVDDGWSGPPKATLVRRAQSYSAFYDVVTAQRGKEHPLERVPSLGEQRHTTVRHQSEAAFEDTIVTAEEQLQAGSHAEYETYLRQLELADDHLAGLLSSTSETLDLLTTLSQSFAYVEQQTNAFRLQCESLIAEQTRLSELSDGIDENSRYYTFLEPMTRRLNAPGAASLVKSHDFPEMLSNLDNCLAYMEVQTTHKEAATYRSRYRLLLTRALTLIRHHFTRSLVDIAADVTKRVHGAQLKPSAQSTLLYAKFRVPAPELKVLGLEIQKRAVHTPDDVDIGREPEYASLMRELYQSYSTTRSRLILPLVAQKMAELDSTPAHANLLAFAQASISYMRGISLDEYELWHEWFETEGALYDYLETLMDPLYDYLRPKIVHETKLETLCELCSTIQARYMEMESEDEDDAESEIVNSSTIHGRRLDFATLVQPALEDAQTRLVFLALSSLRLEIENYRPKPEDLDWPKRDMTTVNGTRKGPALSGTRASVPPTPSTPMPKTPTIVDEDGDSADSFFSKQLTLQTHSTSGPQHYPPLLSALSLLRRIYRLVNSTVFDDLAHRIVHSTLTSLLTASTQLSTQKSAQDGQLFLLVHLLHLKQQILAFDIEFSSPPDIGLDFTNPFASLRDLFNPASWIRAVAAGTWIPKVVENMLDAKSELDARLRTVINDLITAYASRITAPLAAPAAHSDAVSEVQELARTLVPELRRKLAEYIADARTRETLVLAVRDRVSEGYEEFVEKYSEGQGGKKVSRKGKAREGGIMGVGLFAEAMESVFQVGTGHQLEDE